MIHEPECPWAGQPNDDNCPTCNLISLGYKRGREDAALAVMRLIINDPQGEANLTDTMAAARGAQPHQPDTNPHTDLQRFHAPDCNDPAGVENVPETVPDAVTVTNWVRSLLQSGEVDTPAGQQIEHINATETPASTVQNRQDM